MLQEEKDSKSEYVVFTTAPHNFGKTLNIQMLKHYFEIDVDENGNEILEKTKTSNYDVFRKLNIYKNKSFFNQTFGQYPIIYLNYEKLTNIKNYQTMLEQIRLVFLDTFKQHSYLLRVEDIWTEVLHNGILFLSEVLYRHFKRKVIVLIDEYDAFVNNIIFKNTISLKD
ncbi:uncharacterized protein LOC142330355 [Lycorma delicatula]|uniref:uncharacterized protein LOC142330355 n=1 Tax=Lycorma delicatula TaxID=130591 RepID=UPI003F5152C9